MTLEELVLLSLPELEKLGEDVAQAITQKKTEAAVRAEGELLAGDLAADFAEDKKVGPPAEPGG